MKHRRNHILHFPPPQSEVLHFLLPRSWACLAAAVLAQSLAAAASAAEEEEEAFAAAEVWEQGLSPGSAADAAVGQLFVHLAG